MKTKLFSKTAALVMGSLMIFSGQTLAMEANKQEVTNAEALGEVDVLIAQAEPVVPEEAKDIAIDILNVSDTKIGDALSQVQGRVEAGAAKTIAVDIINVASSIVGDAIGDIDVEILTQGDAEVVLNALNNVTTQLGNAEGQIRALVVLEGDNATLAADLVNVVSTSVGDASAAVELAVEQAE